MGERPLGQAAIGSFGYCECRANGRSDPSGTEWLQSLTTRRVSGTIVGIAVEIAPLSCSNMAFCLRRSISAQDANDPVTAVECASASEDLMDVLTIART